MEFITILISTLSLCIAFVALLKSIKALRLQMKVHNLTIQKAENDSIEQKKAKFHCKADSYSGSNQILIQNIGLSVARNIKVIINETEGIFFDEDISRKEVRPNNNFSIPIMITNQAPDELDLAITWDDDYKCNNNENFSVNF